MIMTVGTPPCNSNTLPLKKDTSESPENCKKLAESPTDLANTSFTDNAQFCPLAPTISPRKKNEPPLALSTMIIHTLPHTNYMNMTRRQQKSLSPTNVNAFPSEEWMTQTRPIACTYPVV
jgi:hypothetical protein